VKPNSDKGGCTNGNKKRVAQMHACIRIYIYIYRERERERERGREREGETERERDRERERKGLSEREGIYIGEGGNKWMRV